MIFILFLLSVDNMTDSRLLTSLSLNYLIIVSFNLSKNLPCMCSLFGFSSYHFGSMKHRRQAAIGTKIQMTNSF